MKQAMRERVYEITNPKTRQQATQRMKLTPMQRVGTALGEILKRSWQGIEYGGKGLQEYRKLALKMTSGYPYVDRGELRAIPGAYQISSGSIQGITASVSNARIDLFETTSTTSILDTVGQASQEFIAHTACEEGDQLTIVFCLSPIEEGKTFLQRFYNWHYVSFIIDSTSTENFTSATGGYFGCRAGGENPRILHLTVQNLANSLTAAALIISRPSGNNYMRSPATLALSAALAPWFTDERRREARLTYQAASRATLTGNWEVDPMTASSPGLYTISGSSITELNGTKIWVRYDDDTGDVVGVYVTEESGGAGGTPPYVLGENGSQVFYTSGGNENAANPTDCRLGDVPTIAWSGIPTN